MGLGRVAERVGPASSSEEEEESFSRPIAEGPLLAALRYARKGGVPLLANDLADL